MKKVLINIKNNSIMFSYKTNNSNISSDLINTNIISNNELIFSDIYLVENTKIIMSFIKELTVQYNINTAIISKMDLASLIINLLSKANIEHIIIKEEEALTYIVCDAIINLKNVKSLNCYTLQPFMLELLDKNHITCETRSEILYVSNFMESNNLLNYSNIYYKTNIRITLPLSLEDLQDFKNFCKINKYLKIIHINKLINTELENIVSILKEFNRNNIKIIIHENVNDEKTALYLKDINKKSKNRRIKLVLEYSEDYLNKNLLSQTIISLLKVCSLIISSLVILVITYIGVSNYIALKQVASIKENLAEVVDIIDNQELKEIIDNKNEENIQNEEIETNNIKSVTNLELAALLSVNDDVVGELKINNTNIDYPVVQSKDNDYYLDYNIKKEKNSSGWIFLDYRNDSMNLDKNNIIYGHNAYYSGVMFGTLYKTANKNWYTVPENQIITYNTLYENMKFKIFSIYRVPKTNDYLKVFFENDNDFLSFVTMLTNRSIYNFNVPIKADDKILTLSTCSDNGSKRLVIHAVLVEEEKES